MAKNEWNPALVEVVGTPNVKSSPIGGTGSGSGNSYLPWVAGAASAVLAHNIASNVMGDDERGKKSSTWSKVLRALIPIAVGGAGGVAGYALGNSIKAAADKKENPYAVMRYPGFSRTTDEDGNVMAHDQLFFAKDQKAVQDLYKKQQRDSDTAQDIAESEKPLTPWVPYGAALIPGAGAIWQFGNAWKNMQIGDGVLVPRYTPAETSAMDAAAKTIEDARNRSHNPRERARARAEWRGIRNDYEARSPSMDQTRNHDFQIMHVDNAIKDIDEKLARNDGLTPLQQQRLQGIRGELTQYKANLVRQMPMATQEIQAARLGQLEELSKVFGPNKARIRAAERVLPQGIWAKFLRFIKGKSKIDFRRLLSNNKGSLRNIWNTIGFGTASAGLGMWGADNQREAEDLEALINSLNDADRAGRALKQ